MKKSVYIILISLIIFIMVFSLISCGQNPHVLLLSTSESPSSVLMENAETVFNNLIPVEESSCKEMIESDNNTDDKIFPTKESIPNDLIKIPDRSYHGTWYTDEYKLDDLTIFEMSEEKISFTLGIYRTVNITATAKNNEDEIKYFESESEPLITGTLSFYEDSILVTIIESEFEYILAGTTYNFVVKSIE